MKRVVLCVFVSMLFALIASTTVVASGEVREIRMSIEATGRIADEIQLQIDRFNAMHEDIHVSVHTISGGDAYNQALLGQIAAGVAPDVFLLDGGTRLRMFVVTERYCP
jgi:multiple sugar transport system substrate-binding protein